MADRPLTAADVILDIGEREDRLRADLATARARVEALEGALAAVASILECLAPPGDERIKWAITRSPSPARRHAADA